LNDNVEEANALYFFIPGYYGRKQAKLRIHGTNGAVLAAYADDWKSGNTFTPFGHPCDTKTFCEMVAYALRSGKKDFNLRELEKAFDQKDEPQKETGITIYEDDDARLYLEDEIARLRYKGRLYDFGYDGREPFATIDMPLFSEESEGYDPNDYRPRTGCSAFLQAALCCCGT